MIFDIKNEKSENIPNFKGGEKFFTAKMHYDGLNRFLHGTLVPGATIGEHLHDTNSEIIYILGGEARCLYDDSEERLVPGQCHYCPKGHSHSLVNASTTEPLLFFAVVPEQISR